MDGKFKFQKKIINFVDQSLVNPNHISIINMIAWIIILFLKIFYEKLQHCIDASKLCIDASKLCIDVALYRCIDVALQRCDDYVSLYVSNSVTNYVSKKMTRDTKLHLQFCDVRRYIRNLQLLQYLEKKPNYKFVAFCFQFPKSIFKFYITFFFLS